ncbi:MAG: heat-shock protein [Methanosarcinales archaeon]|nr:heat-shock protein [Methanosarcinales archaeon]
MSITIIIVALGIISLFDSGISLPMPVVLLIFAVFFTLCTVFFQHRGAEYPWSLVGGAAGSLGITFVISSIIGGLIFITSGGLSSIPFNTLLYSISTCMIVSMISLNLVSYKLHYI